jgi:hypothetical protein
MISHVSARPGTEVQILQILRLLRAGAAPRVVGA